MASSRNTTNLLGRRALVTFFAGVAATEIARRAAAASPGSHEADAQLFALWREYLNSEIELNAAQDARDLVSLNARQTYPPKPDCIGGMVIPSGIDDDMELWTATTDM